MNRTVDTTSGVGYLQTTSDSFSESYFYEELNRFRQLFGDKNFWNRPEEQRERMIDGLTHVYLNTVPNDNSKASTEHIQKWATLFDSAMTEYARRGTKMILQAFHESRPDCPICQRPHGVVRGSDGIFRCHMVNHSEPVAC